jgi:acyl carrier protein
MNATDPRILEQTVEVIRKHFRVNDRTPVNADTTSEDLAGWDSLSHALLIIAIEAHFGVELPPERAFEVENVGALAALIAETLP